MIFKKYLHHLFSLSLSTYKVLYLAKSRFHVSCIVFYFSLWPNFLNYCQMLYYIPDTFVTMQLILGVNSRWKGNVPGLCEQASKGLPSAPSLVTGFDRNRPVS